LLPAGEEAGAVVELHGEQVAWRGAGEALQVLSDLAGAVRRGVAAIAERGEGLTAEVSLVGGDDLPGGAGNVDRVLLRREESVPAAVAVGAQRGEAAVEADAVGQAAGGGPCDGAGAVADDEVECGQAGALGDGHGLGGIGGGLQLSDGEVDGAGAVGRPREGEAAAALALADDRAPLGPLRGEGDGLLALHFDERLARRVVGDVACAAVEQLAGVGARWFDDDEIARVGVAIGEAPRDGAVGADEDEGQAGQGEAGDAVRGEPVAPFEDGAIPGARHAEAQVHVAREQGGAGGGAGAGKGKRIGAGRVAFSRVCPVIGGLGGAQIDRRGGWDVRERRAGAVECLVIRAGERREKAGGLFAEDVAHGGVVALVFAGRLQVERERVADEEAVGLAPRAGCGAQKMVFPGLRTEGGESGVDALGVAAEQRTLVGGELGECGLGVGAEVVKSVGAVGFQGAFAEECGELAGGAPPHEVHLEEAILGVQPAEGCGEIGACGAAERGRAEGIALGRDGRGQTGQRSRAVKAWQAGAQARVAPAGKAEAEEKGRAGDGEGVAEKTGTSHDEGAARLRLMYRLSGGVQCRVASDSTHPSVAAS